MSITFLPPLCSLFLFISLPTPVTMLKFYPTILPLTNLFSFNELYYTFPSPKDLFFQNLSLALPAPSARHPELVLCPVSTTAPSPPSSRQRYGQKTSFIPMMLYTVKSYFRVFRLFIGYSFPVKVLCVLSLVCFVYMDENVQTRWPLYACLYVLCVLSLG